MTDEPDFIRAKRKIADATNWLGDVNVSLGGETVSFKHRLLTESEFLEIKRSLNLSELQGESGNVGQTDAQERLLELQQKDELTEEDEAELESLSQEVAGQTDKIEDALGEDGYEILMDMGRRAIAPSEEYVNYVYDSNTAEMKQHMGVETLPNPLTRDTVADHLSEQMVSTINNQPFPIKLNIGMQAFSETLSVLGNGLQQ